MTSKIIMIDGAFEIWGFYNEGILVRTNKLRVRAWR